MIKNKLTLEQRVARLENALNGVGSLDYALLKVCISREIDRSRFRVASVRDSNYSNAICLVGIEYLPTGDEFWYNVKNAGDVYGVYTHDEQNSRYDQKEGSARDEYGIAKVILNSIKDADDAGVFDIWEG